MPPVAGERPLTQSDVGPGRATSPKKASKNIGHDASYATVPTVMSRNRIQRGGPNCRGTESQGARLEEGELLPKHEGRKKSKKKGFAGSRKK